MTSKYLLPKFLSLFRQKRHYGQSKYYFDTSKRIESWIYPFIKVFEIQMTAYKDMIAKKII